MTEEIDNNATGEDRRAAILQALRERQRQGIETRASIPLREAPERPTPLSFAQERLWFLERLEDLESTYHVSRTSRLFGPLDPNAMERALRALCARHESLRTGFVLRDGTPFQVASAEPVMNYVFCDIRIHPEDQRAAKLREIVESMISEPFDLESPGLIRTRLIRCEDQEHVLALVIHHIVTDGWSMGVLVRDLQALYTAQVSGTALDLPKMPIQFGDYAAWQRATIAGPALDRLMDYWRSVLGDIPEPLELPTDFARAASASHEGGMEQLNIGAAELEPIRRLCRDSACTFSMGLLAIFKILMSRWSGRDDIAVGTAVANRGLSELEPLIGFLINTLVLRTDVSSAFSFRELLGRVRDAALGAYSHQDMPFEKLVEELNPPRDASRNPLFQVFFNHYTEMVDQDARFANLDSEPYVIKGHRDSKFDLTLYVRETKEEIALRLVYRSDLFKSDRMAELLSQFRHLMGEAVRKPDIPISELSLITSAAARLLPDPRIALEEPTQVPVPELVCSWAERAADQPAVEQGKQRWTYGELCGGSAALAREIGRKGIRSGDVVAIHGPRSFGFVLSMLGVLRSGAAMLLIDPSLPAERKRLMIGIAAARAIVRIGEDVGDVSWMDASDPGLVLIDVQPNGEGLLGDRELLDHPPVAVSGSEPAYIFFTSGTTGKPKGVTGTHKGLSHFITWQGETFAISPDDRAAQLTTQSFDVVLRDVLTPLAHGATLCLPQTPDRLDSNTLWTWLRRAKITILHTVPSLAEMWLTHAHGDVAVPSLRRVFFAGEPLTATLVRRWMQVCVNTSVVNLYGPTETTMAKCYHLVEQDPPDGVQPIGRPLPNTQALVLSSTGNLCAAGETGEIAIRTPFRTLGYIGADETENSRFSMNPSRDDVDDLLFRTGDRGRYRPDGSLEFLGRLDNQVKVRGVRIELGEVSDAVARHVEVDACHIAVVKDDHGQSHVIAYVVFVDPARGSAAGLRADLSRIVPPVMVPSIVVPLEQLPLTINGKIDRARLPEVSLDRLAREHEFVAPEGPYETKIAAILQDVLRLERVGALDSFFDLGGHSMLAVELFGRIEQEFGCSLPLSVLYHAGTVRDLAAEVKSGTQPKQWSSIVPIDTNGNRPPLFLVHGVAGNVIFFRGLAERLSKNQPVYAIQPETVDGRVPPERTLEAMASRYVQELTRLQPVGPYRIGGFSFGGLVAYEMARQILAAGEGVEMLLIFDTRSGVPRPSLKPGRNRSRRRVMGRFPMPSRRRFLRWLQGRASEWQRKQVGLAGLVNARVGRRIPVGTRPEFTAWYCSRLARAYRIRPCEAGVIYFSTQPSNEAEILRHWEGLARGGLRVYRVSGKHKEGLFDEPNVTDVARLIETQLQESSGQSGLVPNESKDSAEFLVPAGNTAVR